MNLKDVREWNIFIDNVDGELAMEKREDSTGRLIEVIAKEEILPLIKELENLVAYIEENMESPKKIEYAINEYNEMNK